MIYIDLTRKDRLDESLMKAWGAWNKTLLKYIYGKDTKVVANLNEEEKEQIEFKIKGEYEDVKSYALALTLEAVYLRSYIEEGKDSPKTLEAKEKANAAAKDFTERTGLPWPFKD